MPPCCVMHCFSHRCKNSSGRHMHNEDCCHCPYDNTRSNWSLLVLSTKSLMLLITYLKVYSVAGSTVLSWSAHWARLSAFSLNKIPTWKDTQVKWTLTPHFCYSRYPLILLLLLVLSLNRYVLSFLFFSEAIGMINGVSMNAFVIYALESSLNYC